MKTRSHENTKTKATLYREDRRARKETRADDDAIANECLDDVDDRGYIYTADRANTASHILELTGASRKVANWTGQYLVSW